MTDIFCGANKIPKNKRRGTAKECYRANQVRFYGIEAVPASVLAKDKRKVPIKKQLTDAELKLQKLVSKAQGIQRNARTQIAIIKSPSASDRDKRRATKELDLIKEKGKKLAPRVKANILIVKDLKDKVAVYEAKKEAAKLKKEKEERKANKVTTKKKKGLTKKQIDIASTELVRKKSRTKK